MPSSIPRTNGRKRCKVCLQNLGKGFWMENLGDRIKCPNCGREVAIGSRKSPHRGVLRSADLVRFRTGQSRQGGERTNNASDFKPKFFKTVSSKPRETRKVSVGKLSQELDVEVFVGKDFIEVIGVMSGVEKEDIVCSVDDGVLKINTIGERKYNGKIEIAVPVNEEFELNYRNGILEIKLTKKKGEEKNG